MPPTEEDLAWFRSTFHPVPKPALPDDCLEFSLYIVSSTLDASHDSELRLRLREVQKSATELYKRFLKDYIWQRQGFTLEIQKEDGLSFLRGRTEYGDSLEDEWVIVWLVRELTRPFPDLWAKVTDSDGEFLLIEASGTLPAWLEPDVADNRVWIHDGQLKIIKPAASARSSKRTTEKLDLADARRILLEEPRRLMHSTSLEEEAFYRLRDYPDQIARNMHHALVTLPRKVAFLLHQKPSYIAPAIEAFYLRDPIALKPLKSKEHKVAMTFAPEDFVTVSVKFPRVAYAQVKAQEFPGPAVFAGTLPSRTDAVAFTRADTGMKVTCGFEILVTDPLYQDRPAVRGIKIVLDDLATGDESLPSNGDMDLWERTEDDESWLDISFDDLERELAGHERPPATGKKPGFGDRAAQENLQRIVQQFEQFLNDDDDGAPVDESDDDLDDDERDDGGEDKEASFGEDEFSKMMQEMMGMPPEVMKEIMSGKLGAGAAQAAARDSLRPYPHAAGRVVDDDGADSGSDDEDITTFMKGMEAELRGTNATKLGPSSAPTALKQSAGSTAVAADASGDELSSEDDMDQQIDADLARNLLESLRTQEGRAGPGGNLMAMMGLHEESRVQELDDDQAGPSGTARK